MEKMIAIIDYKAGNAPSVRSALEHIGAPCALVKDADGLSGATHIILPGVGSAGATMRSLEESGFVSALTHLVMDKKLPFLGICVGMQIIFEHSEEDDADCLGWLGGQVSRFNPRNVRVPQIGWNKVRFLKDSPLSPAGKEDYYYFVNSYFVRPADISVAAGMTDYGGDFVSCVSVGNICATQFHAEKSGEAGLDMLRRFTGVGGV